MKTRHSEEHEVRRGVQLIVYNSKSYSNLAFLSPVLNGFAINLLAGLHGKRSLPLSDERLTTPSLSSQFPARLQLVHSPMKLVDIFQAIWIVLLVDRFLELSNF